MSVLARNGMVNLPAVSHATAPATSANMSLADVWQMAEHVAASKLFAVTTPQQAFALMMLCQSEGIHPMQAVRRYHIIQGRPVMRSDAVQGEMVARGWKIQPIRRDAKEARAAFSHPTKLPEGFDLGVTFEQYKAVGLTTKDVWKNYADDMLWARLMTKACRTLDPGIIAGVYSPEEVDDIIASESAPVVHARGQIEAARVMAEADVSVPGWDGGPGEWDGRAYSAVVMAAVKAVTPPGGTSDPAVVHRALMLRAIEAGYAEGPPASVSAAVKAMAKLYIDRRDWLRTAIVEAVEEMAESAADGYQSEGGPSHLFPADAVRREGDQVVISATPGHLFENAPPPPPGAYGTPRPGREPGDD